MIALTEANQGQGQTKEPIVRGSSHLKASSVLSALLDPGI